MKVATSIKSLTPKELYDKFLDGERPRYVHDIDADKPMKELEVLASKYRQTLAYEDKKNLLRQEREILYEELDKPELTLARNYNAIKNVIPQNCDLAPKYAEQIIDAMNIEGIARIEECVQNGFVYDFDSKKAMVLKNAYDKLGDDDLSIMLKEKLACVASYVFDKYNENLNEEDTDAMTCIYYGCQNSDLSDSSVENDDFVLNMDINDIVTPNEFMTVIMSTPLKKKGSIVPIIEKILLNDSYDISYKRYAVWGAGKFRSEKNFDYIKRIALDEDEKDIRLREFAIHSTALYLREKPDEVRSIMKKVSNEQSIFAPLGKILNDKVNGNYLGNINADLKYENTSSDDICLLTDFKNTNITLDSELNVSQQRDIYRNLLQYKNVLKTYGSYFPKIYVLKDTYTRIEPEKSGKRYFNPKSFLNSGNYFDTYSGIYTGNTIMLNKKDVGVSHSVLAHEMGHALNDMFDYNDHIKLKSLYNNAIKNGNAMCEYSKSSEREYFAMGCQAMSEVYVPHSTLLFDSTSTRYKLLAYDPKLFNFVKNCLYKY